MKALAKEAEMETNYLQEEKINTIYFGGGTPSILNISDLEFLISNLYTHYDLAADAEITLEANPDDLDQEKLSAWKSVGINRLSIGVQSFFDEELKWMNRAHNAQQAINNLELARKKFDNITIDLIYGSPLQTDNMWKENVNKAIEFEIPHLSCYALTVEEKTPLYKSIATQKTPDVDNEKQARHFLMLMAWAREKGYEHYEVSNFARPGFRSRHNSSYWKGENYLGLGPSAHSYNKVTRRWNIANNGIYIRSILEKNPQRETETLTKAQKLNEYIMISLRTLEGIDLNKLENDFGFGERKIIEEKIRKFIASNLVRANDFTLQLTDEGMLRADGIASELFS